MKTWFLQLIELKPCLLPEAAFAILKQSCNNMLITQTMAIE
jgi:hypothetical protein